MTNTILSGTQGVQIQSNYGSGFTLQNMGPGNVYLDNYPSVSPGASWTLIPGMSIPVSPNTVLWACTDTGQTAEVQTLLGVQAQAATITEISGTVEIGEVTLAPGSEVGISGPVTASISGGTVDIGTGTIDATITNSTVNVGGTVKNQSGNYGQLLATASASWVVGNTNPVVVPLPAIADVSQWNSLILDVSFDNVLGNGLPTAVGTYITAVFNQNGIPYYQAQWLGAYSGALEGVACRRAQIPLGQGAIGFSVGIPAFAAATTHSGTITASVYGSAHSVDGPRYINSVPGIFLPGKPTGQSVSYGGAGGPTPIDSANVPGVLSIQGNAAGAGNVVLQEADSGTLSRGLNQATIAAGGLFNTVPFIAPMRPLFLTTTLTAGSLTSSVEQ